MSQFHVRIKVHLSKKGALKIKLLTGNDNMHCDILAQKLLFVIFSWVQFKNKNIGDFFKK